MQGHVTIKRSYHEFKLLSLIASSVAMGTVRAFVISYLLHNQEKERDLQVWTIGSCMVLVMSLNTRSGKATFTAVTLLCDDTTTALLLYF